MINFGSFQIEKFELLEIYQFLSMRKMQAPHNRNLSAKCVQKFNLSGSLLSLTFLNCLSCRNADVCQEPCHTLYGLITCSLVKGGINRVPNSGINQVT